MDYISSNTQKPKKSARKIIAIILIIISSIGYFALFSGFLGFLKHFLLGFFGVFAYPLFFAGYCLSYMLFKDKKFVMPKKFVVYICLALFSLLCIFHLAFSTHLSVSSYGTYLSQTYNGLSVGGLLISLFTYPLVISIQYFGAFVLFGVLLIFSAYKIIDYFIINKGSINFPKINKKQKTRIEEVKISSSASNYLNDQIFSKPEESANIVLNAEINSEEVRRLEAKRKLGIGEVRNKPAETNNNKQLNTFNKFYAQEDAPIFNDEESENLDEKLSNFNAFNYSTFNKSPNKENNKNRKEKNLEFFRATIDPNFRKSSMEDIAKQKKRNLNLDDNLKNLPINDLIKESEELKQQQQNELNLKNETNNYNSTEQNQPNNLIDENQNKKEETTNSGDKISDVKIDDLINKVKNMEQNEDVPKETKKYTQTNLLDNKKEPKMATYKKPSKYVRPTTDLLNNISTDANNYCSNYEEKARTIETTLENFKVPAKVIGVTCGPAVTRFELEMPPGISVNKINQYSNDIAMALASSHGVRIEAPIPGKSAVGIEVPNDEIATVGLREVLESKEFYGAKGKLTFALGKDINGKYRVCDLSKMPHLLVAGTTGSGKSVCLNVLLVSLLYKCSPEELRLVIVDPKRVEFSMFNNLPHLLIPEIISSSDKAINALNYLINEMEHRYELFEELYVKKLEEYNETEEVARGERPKLPYIVMVIDEMNDLMSSNKKEIEDRVTRIAQKARAAGIHLILATQRPSVDVITGTIKANLPSRIAFAVSSFIDSKTILDRVGAEKLLGKGDMLYYPQELPEPARIQCAFISNEELKNVIQFVKQNNECVFNEDAERQINKSNEGNTTQSTGYDPNEVDSLMQDALKYVIEIGQASISKLQRHFALGFSRAGKIIDQMERLHYISPADGSKPRTVYITMDEYRQIYGE